MKSITRFFTLAALGSALAASAFAGTTVNMKFLGAPNSDNGVGIYPYNFTVDGSPMPLLCDAFSNHIVDGETWTATEHDLFSGTFQFGNQPVLYEQAAYIFLEIVAGSVNIGDANFAIWDIFDHPDVDGNAGFNANAQNILNNAMANAPTDPSFYANVRVFTPNDGTEVPPGETPQEFFGLIPEPSSMALLGTGMLGIAFAGRKLWA